MVANAAESLSGRFPAIGHHPILDVGSLSGKASVHSVNGAGRSYAHEGQAGPQGSADIDADQPGYTPESEFLLGWSRFRHLGGQ